MVHSMVQNINVCYNEASCDANEPHEVGMTKNYTTSTTEQIITEKISLLQQSLVRSAMDENAYLIILTQYRTIKDFCLS